MKASESVFFLKVKRGGGRGRRREKEEVCGWRSRSVIVRATLILLRLFFYAYPSTTLLLQNREEV